jgi:hypothetical protein
MRRVALLAPYTVLYTSPQVDICINPHILYYKHATDLTAHNISDQYQ